MLQPYRAVANMAPADSTNIKFVLSLTTFIPTKLSSHACVYRSSVVCMFVYSLAAGISVVGLVKFTSQGDNSGDARELADYLNQWLMMKQVHVTC